MDLMEVGGMWILMQFGACIGLSLGCIVKEDGYGWINYVYDCICI